MVWKLQDVDNSSIEYEFEIGPATMSMASVSKESSSQYLDHVNDLVLSDLIIESGSMSFTGTLLSENQLDELTDWAKRRKTAFLYDYLDRKFLVAIESFVPKRVYSANDHWKHTWDLQVFMIEQVV